MIPTEQPRFFDLVNQALAAYVKAPTGGELEAWWATCRHFTFDDVDRVLKAHTEDPDDGKRAPRPIDVKRRLGAGTRSGMSCAARGPGGGCQYPGIFAESTSGSDVWWCPWHFHDRVGPEAARWIDVSHEVPYARALEKRAARMLDEAQTSPSVRMTAWDIAKRHGPRPWQPSRAAFAMPAGAPAPINMDAEPA